MWLIAQILSTIVCLKSDFVIVMVSISDQTKAEYDTKESVLCQNQILYFDI